jgi:hypothetical protein
LSDFNRRDKVEEFYEEGEATMYEARDGKKFGSRFVGRRYDHEHEKEKEKIYCIRHGQTALDDMHRSDGWL